MENNEMKKCPYCAEMVKAEAIKCRYCGSDLRKTFVTDDNFPLHWQRLNRGKKIAGVCTGIAKEIDSPIMLLPIRIFFILTTFFWGFGLLLYIALWILMPGPTDPKVYVPKQPVYKPAETANSGCESTSPVSEEHPTSNV